MKNKCNFIKSLSILTFFIIISFRSDIYGIFAQTVTSTQSAQTITPTKNPSKLDENIMKLKDKIATKVAQITQSSSINLEGNIIKIDANQFVLNTSDKEYTVNFDPETIKIYSLLQKETKETNKDALKKDQNIVINGYFLDKELSAKIIYIQSATEPITGQIIDINKSEYTITIITTSKEEITLDIEKDTIQNRTTLKDLTIKSSGFSEYKVNDYIFGTIVKRDKSSNRTKAIRTYTVDSLLLIK